MPVGHQGTGCTAKRLLQLCQTELGGALIDQIEEAQEHMEACGQQMRRSHACATSGSSRASLATVSSQAIEELHVSIGGGHAKQHVQRGNKQLTQVAAHIDEQLAQMRPIGDKQLAQVGAISDEQLAAI